MKFYVGQRVRIKYSVAWPELNGTEGTVIGVNMTSWSKEIGILHGCCQVQPDIWENERAPYDGDYRRFGPLPEQLEPLQDDGRQVISWKECLWQPEDYKIPA